MNNKKVVFLGDSITECYNLEEFFPDLNLINEGKSGDTTTDILKRLKESVFAYTPSILILLIGTNDLELLNSRPEEVINGIKKIVKEVKSHDENIKIYLQSIYPVDYEIKPFSVGKRQNKDILIINEEIKNIKEVTYLDLHQVLTTKTGKLNKDYTYDGIHINKKGYEVITEYLNKKVLF